MHSKSTYFHIFWHLSFILSNIQTNSFSNGYDNSKKKKKVSDFLTVVVMIVIHEANCLQALDNLFFTFA